MKYMAATILIAMFLILPASAEDRNDLAGDFSRYEWTLENGDADWARRAGLQVVELDGQIYLIGGRTPLDPMEVPVPGASTIHGDVWRSGDQGSTWEQILATEDEGHWPARAYFQALTLGDEIFVIGGQDFNVIDNPDPEGPPLISFSNFFSDIWSSADGIEWTERTAAAGWEGRAGLSAVVFRDEIYVLGGSVNDDDAIGGPGGPPRIYFNDVWKSADGENWEMVTDSAPWEPRAGGIALSFNGYLYLVGGEAGFLCAPFPCDPPYFNDVWRTRDGVEWELVTPEAEWSARPGHQVVVVDKHMVLFGGFGLSDDPSDPFAPGNPMDVWASGDGALWEQVDDTPWNAASPGDVKYDLDALVVDAGPNGLGPAILTFGGDRETFDFTDFTNWLNVDNDVWRFTLPARFWLADSSEMDKAAAAKFQLTTAPNPFNPITEIRFELPGQSNGSLRIFDARGRRVNTLHDGVFAAGAQRFVWNGQDDTGRRMATGTYIYRLEVEGHVVTRKMVLAK